LFNNKKSIRVDVLQIQIGVFVMLPLEWDEHPFVLNCFLIKTEEELSIIQSLPLDFIHVVPELSIAEVISLEDSLEVIPDDSETLDDIGETDEGKLTIEESIAAFYDIKKKRIARLKAFNKALITAESDFLNSMDVVTKIMREVKLHPVQAFGRAKQLIVNIIDLINNQSEILLHFINGKREGDKTYLHSLNVAILSILVGKSYGLSEHELNVLGIAGLFHDIGKIKLPTQLLRKKEKLTVPETKLMECHVSHGIELMAMIKNIDETVVKIISQHHEYNDGTGYPHGLKKKQIHPLARILIPVNEYDGLCHPNDEKQAKTPHAALSYLFKVKKHKFDHDTLGYIVKYLSIYPPGTVVELETGQIALVVAANRASLLRPNVLIYDPSIPREEAAIIGLASAKIKVKKALDYGQLADDVLEYLTPLAASSYYSQKPR
jgi:putative nucleotidyltransferase with HDIG domain